MKSSWGNRKTKISKPNYRKKFALPLTLHPALKSHCPISNLKIQVKKKKVKTLFHLIFSSNSFYLFCSIYLLAQSRPWKEEEINKKKKTAACTTSFQRKTKSHGPFRKINFYYDFGIFFLYFLSDLPIFPTYKFFPILFAL